MLLQYLQTVAVISKGKSTQRSNTKKGMLLLVGCIMSHHHFSISQDGCAQTILSAATLIEAVDVTCYLVQSQYTDMGLISPSMDPVTPGVWQGSHWSTNFNSFYPVDEYTRPQAIAPRDRGRVYSSSTVVCISLLLNRFKVLFGSLYPHIRFR